MYIMNLTLIAFVFFNKIYTFKSVNNIKKQGFCYKNIKIKNYEVTAGCNDSFRS